MEILLNLSGDTAMNIAFRPLLYQLQSVHSSINQLLKGVSGLVHLYSTEC